MNKAFIFIFIMFFSPCLWAGEAGDSAKLMGDQAQGIEKPASSSINNENSAQVRNWLDSNVDQPYIALTSEYVTTLQPDWSYVESYHTRIKVQKEEAKELAQWPIYYNKSRDDLTDIQAHVETADGHVVMATDIQDQAVAGDNPLYSNFRMKVINLPQIDVGSIIDITVKSKTANKEIPGQFWAEILYPAIPSQHASHTYIFPQDKTIQLSSYKTSDKPVIEKSGDFIKYTFSFDFTKALATDEELMPPLQDVLGAQYLSSITDWALIADWFRALAVKSMQPDPDISLKSIELTKNKATQKEKAKAILEFLQDSFKFEDLNFGDNTVEPNLTKDVFKIRSADSKDLSILAKHMLKIAGIDARLCLFSPEFAGNPQAGLPSPSVFNHVILQLTLDGQDYFVDPVLKGFEFGQYPSAYDHAYVLIVQEAGYGFDNLPVAPAEHRALISQAIIDVHADGFASFKVHVKLPAETSQAFKQTWKASNEEEKEKFFANLEKNFTKGGKMLDKKISGMDERYAQVEIDMTYEAPTAYPVVNDMILIKEEDQADIPNFIQDSRQYPIFSPNNSLIKNQNTYQVPQGYKIGFIPSDYSLSNELMDVSAHYIQKEDSIELDSLYLTKRCTIPSERYGQIKDFRKDLAKKNDQYIVFKKSSDVSPHAKDWINK